MAEKLSLDALKPASPRRDRKRVGRGLSSGKGRYSGRGIKGQKARSGSRKMRPGFEGGQNPIYMRLGKQRGPYSADAMPMGPHRTQVQAVNVRDLDRFDGEVTPDALKEAGLIRSTKIDVKILGHGDLKKKLTVSAHLFSKSAREKIEGAGGSITWLRGEPVEDRRPGRKRRLRSGAKDEAEKRAAPRAASERDEPEATEEDTEAAPQDETPAEEETEG